MNKTIRIYGGRWIKYYFWKGTLPQRLMIFKRNPKVFLRRLITVDEALVYTRNQGIAEIVTLLSEPAPKKAKAMLAAVIVMTTVFWGSQVLIYINY